MQSRCCELFDYVVRNIFVTGIGLAGGGI